MQTIPRAFVFFLNESFSWIINFPQWRIYSISIYSLKIRVSLNHFYMKKSAFVLHRSFLTRPFSTRLSSVLLLPLLLSLASGFSFDNAKQQRQQQLDQPEKDVDEHREDDNQNERDVDEMILVPG